MNLAESLLKKLEYDSHLVINRLGKFYLRCLKYGLRTKGRSEVIAPDPGVCTFMTGYDLSEMAIE
ncbi:hypothetical protein C2G38_2188024 [Gigaspora rosea]|uniref:Uncharacterized protein n=1 Tax=Gigaspora rosea TaxID=44941 RepID=A0A397V6E3_9GLOM|nr:hypothetical protein C2G38_2188024 [Gigaspora rosea]